MPPFPSSKIKDIYIELIDDYRFYHGTTDQNNPFFIGRGRERERLKLLLEQSASSSGAYLIAGYRGMGKTSLVEEVIKELNKNDPNKFKPIKISLSQEEVNDLDILRPIARQLYLDWDGYRNKSLNFRLLLWSLFCAAFASLFVVTLWKIVEESFINKTINAIYHIDVWQGYFTYIIQSNIFIIVTLIILLLLFISIIMKVFSHFYNSYIANYTPILKQLEDLNKRLDAQIIRETLNEKGADIKIGGNGAIWKSNAKQSSKLQQSYPIASTKEIEKELIAVFEKIDKCREKTNKQPRLLKWKIPNYIIVIDELDKIEPNYIFNMDDDKAAQQLLSADFNVFGGNKIKKRQIAVARILANLKSFLSVAKAKFIFIGGREMYDAFLADIADRDSFYSSIFNDVIYVNSFFKDKVSEGGGVSKMTELYLCKLLLNKTETPGNYFNLSDYYACLIGIDGKPEAKDDKNQVVNLNNGVKKKYVTRDEKLKIYKTIFLLQNFIIFLTYRSNGSPKKLADLVAGYVVRGIKNPDESVVIENPSNKNNDAKLYLRFSFKDQYEIGLTSSLYRPYVIIHSRHLKQLGDKLLYSTAYIIDYILKFHQQAFSWRSLELIPDIILVNKDPNLRYFLEDMMRFLSYMHIRETISGVFQYKFYSKVSAEIKFISKISEASSAAFNFGLDESFQIKSYYKSKLTELQNSHKEFSIVDKENTFVHSISFIQTILGDLHYYDKEYDDAIVYYSDSIQAIRNTKDYNKITNHQAVLFVRNKLKLGLCLEKVRAFDSAYSIYRSLILKVPHIIGPKREEAKSDGWETPYVRMQLFIKPYIALLGLIEKQRIDGITYANLRRNRLELDKFLGSNASRYLKEEPNLNEAYEPGEDLKTNEEKEEENKVKKAKDWRRVWALNFDYFNSVGGFLFYKNRNFPALYESELVENTESGKIAPLFKEFGKNHLSDFVRFMNSKIDKLADEQSDSKNQEVTNNKDSNAEKNMECDYTPSISAYIYYRWALRELFKIYKGHAEKYFPKAPDNDSQKAPDNEFVQALNLLRPEFTDMINSTNFYMFGNLFTKIGDTVLSMISRHSIGNLEDEVIKIFLEEDSVSAVGENGVLSKIEKWFDKKDKNTNDKKRYDINFVLILYRIAGLFYAKANRTWSYAFQYKKFLYLVKDYITFFGKEKTGSINSMCIENLEKIAEKIFRSITWVGDISNRPQIIKYREILQQPYPLFNQPDMNEKNSVADNQSNKLDENYNLDTAFIYNNLSTNAEVREVILLIEEIRLKLGKLNTNNSKKIIPLLTPYDTISSMFTRALELKYKSEYNYYQLAHKHKYEHWEVLSKLPTKFNREEFEPEEKFSEIAEITVDAIFCLFEVIRLLNLYGISYTTNHSFLANAHYKLANWCNVYWNIEAAERHLSESEIEMSIRDRIKKTLDSTTYNYLESNYHNEMAIQHYYAAIQTHQEGKAYRDQLNSLSFSEDDFNDNLSHFSAASERLRVNTGVIRKKIEELKEKVKDSRLYKYEYYIEGHEESVKKS